MAQAEVVKRKRLVNWPNGAQCAAFISFDVDAETMWLARNPANILRPGTLSQGTFEAKVGVPRILELLREREMTCSFYIPGWVANHHQRMAENIVAGGHEIGHHGYLHRWIDPENPAEEEEEFLRGIEALVRVCGTKPVGYRSPAGETSPHMLKLLMDHDFIYEGSMLDDVVPYRLRLAGRKETIVELPWHWSLDDVPFMVTSIHYQRPMFSNEHILSIWKAEFREIYAEGGLFTLAMHPQAIGRPSRMALLREMLDYISTFDDVFYGTGLEIAKAWAAATPDVPEENEITAFLPPDAYK